MIQSFKDKLDPIHPGEILLEEFLKPMDISVEQIALAIHFPTEQLNDIVQDKQNMIADLALRLARYFDMSPQFWLGLQMDYDLDMANDALAGRLEIEVPVYVAAD